MLLNTAMQARERRRGQGRAQISVWLVHQAWNARRLLTPSESVYDASRSLRHVLTTQRALSAGGKKVCDVLGLAHEHARKNSEKVKSRAGAVCFPPGKSAGKSEWPSSS